MRTPFFVFFLLFTLLSACSSPCTDLRERDEKIMSDFQELQAKEHPSTDLRYIAKLKVLYEKEQALLREVRNCEISDPVEFNYWYGERLKYPSELERTYIKLTDKP
ncbi:MAG TPA: hypothetical protein VJ953_13755 [Saprospiraceae bacterium]|nr:hypothetical protein [Saprospiraceae bacterium]